MLASSYISLPKGLPKADPSVALPNVITFLAVVAGAISVLVIVLAGVQIVISSGEPSKIQKARSAILYACVGLAISISATSLASIIPDLAQKATEISQNNPNDGIVIAVINVASSYIAWIGGAVAVIFMVYGAFKYSSSGGDSTKVTSARNTIVYSAVGLFIIVVSRTLIAMIISYI